MTFLGASAIGVDVTDGTLKAVKLVRRGRRVRLAASWRIPCHRDEDRERAALAALASFAGSARPDGLTSVIVAAPDHGHASRTYIIPTMATERLADMVRYEVLSELRLAAEDTVVRFHARKGVVEREVHAVAFDRGRLDTFTAQLREARIPFDELHPPGYALASFVEHEQPLGRDRVVLGVGERSTELVLLRDDGLWTRHLPFGVADERRPAVLAERLASEVEAAAAFLLPDDTPFRPADAVLTEEGALSARLTTELTRALALPVTRFGELPRIDTPGRLRGSGATEAQTLAMGKALGLALTGLGLARFPCPLVSGNPRRAALRTLPSAAAGLVVASLGLFGMTHLALDRADTLATTLAEDLPGEMEDLLRRSQETRAELGTLQGRADGLLALARRRPAVMAVRTALDRVAQVVATRGSETLHVDSVWLAPGDTARPSQLTLTLDADPGRDEALAAALPETFRGVFEDVTVAGPSPAPERGLSRWVVEIVLP